MKPQSIQGLQERITELEATVRKYWVLINLNGLMSWQALVDERDRLQAEVDQTQRTTESYMKERDEADGFDRPKETRPRNLYSETTFPQIKRHMDIPSKEAIEAAIKAYYGDEPTGQKETDYWSNMLKAAYAIDFSTHQQAMQDLHARVKELEADVNHNAGRVIQETQRADRLQEEVASLSERLTGRDDFIELIKRQSTLLQAELEGWDAKWHVERKARLHYEEIAKLYGKQRDDLEQQLDDQRDEWESNHQAQKERIVYLTQQLSDHRAEVELQAEALGKANAVIDVFISQLEQKDRMVDEHLKNEIRLQAEVDRMKAESDRSKAKKP